MKSFRFFVNYYKHFQSFLKNHHLLLYYYHMSPTSIIIFLSPHPLPPPNQVREWDVNSPSETENVFRARKCPDIYHWRSVMRKKNIVLPLSEVSLIVTLHVLSPNSRTLNEMCQKLIDRSLIRDHFTCYY